MDTLQDRLAKQIANKRLSAKDRAFYETMQLFVVFLVDDHKKVAEMYEPYKAIEWFWARPKLTLAILAAMYMFAVSNGPDKLWAWLARFGV